MNYAYCRVSTAEQEKGDNILSQVYAIESYAKQQGLKLEHIFKDEAWSGSILQRPALDELRQLVSDGKVKRLFIYHPDRLSREQTHQLLLLDEFKKAEVELIFTSIPSYFNGGTESTIVNRSIYSMISELERVRIKERTRLGKLRKVNDGKLITSKPPYGYKYIIGENRLELDPEESKVAKMILDWASEGISQRKIIKLLKAKGIKTRQGNEVWGKSTVSKITKINLDVYTGVWHYNKYKMTTPKNPTQLKKYRKREKSSRALNNKDEWMSVTLPKELRIISKKQADKIRVAQARNKTRTGKTKNFYLLRGLAYCDLCKGTHYCDSTRGVTYYRCGDRQRKFPSKDHCKAKSFQAEPVEESVWNDLVSLVSDKDLIKQQAEKYIQRQKTDTLLQGQKEEIVRERLELEKQKANISELLVKGLIDESDAISQRERVLNEIKILEDKETELKAKQSNRIDASSLLDNIDELQEEIIDFLKETKGDERRKCLEWLGVKVFIHNNNYSIFGNISLNVGVSPQLTNNMPEVQQSIRLPFVIKSSLNNSNPVYQFA